MIHAALFLLGSVAPGAAPTTNVATNVVLVPCGARHLQSLPAAGESLTLAAGGAGELTLVERGLQISVEGGDVVRVTMPLRLGRFSVQLPASGTAQIRLARPGSAHGSIDVGLDCAPDEASRKLRTWFARVQSLEKQIADPQPGSAFDRLVAQLDAIRADAAAGYPAALAQHLRAAALDATGRSAEALQAFATAKAAWLAQGDPERALAALVAETENALRTGAYEKAMALTRSLGDAPDRSRYFGVRLEDSRCLALEYLTRLDEAATCFDWVVHALSDLGEDLERISAQQDYAQLELDRGDSAHAATLAGDALAAISEPQWDLIEGPDVPIVRGRIERVLSDSALRGGDIADSLRHSQRALAQFKQAHHLRWQANMLLRLAATYRDIGAYADAMDAVDAALLRLSARDAPARIAMAEFAKARIAQDSGDAAQAAEHAASARSLFDSLKMPADAAAAALTLAEAKLAAGQPGEARATVDAIGTIRPAQIARAELVKAEIALDGGAEGGAVDSDTLRSTPRPLSEWLRVQAVLARRLHAQGQRDAALHALDLAAQHVADLAARARNPILRLALARRQRQLLAVALPMIASGGSTADTVEAVWRWLLRSELAPPRIEIGAAVATADDFDHALAASLLPRPSSGSKPNPDDRLQEHLLELVAGASVEPRHAVPAPATTLAASHLQALLPRDTALLAVLAEGSSATLLYLASDKAEVFVLPDAEALRAAARRLPAAIAGDERLGAIEAAASTMSRSLLGVLDGATLPHRLWIIAPEPFDAVPWPMLSWPGAAEPLVATTSVSLAVPGERATRANAAPIRLHLFATTEITDSNGLSGLPAAAGELSNIEQQRRERSWRLLTDVEPRRATVLAALADPDSWVHLAGHGSSMAEYLGRSGIWLTASQGSDAELLSWMDVVERGTRADVVVLNACALGSSPATSLSASSGFAETTLRAGANDVIAALWPINDTAASLWPRTFYALLPAQPTSEDIADALRASMLRLRDSRAYRHPKYWASLVHLMRLDPAAPAGAHATP